MAPPPPSQPGSSSDPIEIDDSVSRPQDIATLEDLYADGTLDSRPSATPVAYPVKAALLSKVSVVKGDITEFAVDVIVNAANKSLLGGGGVDGAIHSAAGPELKKACRLLDGAETGETKLTDAFRLPAKRIAHTVGPIFHYDNRDKSERLLRSCYEGCLQATVDEGLQTIAFCSISTGIYGYPIKDATHVALDTVRNFLASERGSSITRVIFVVFSPKDLSVYLSLLPTYFPTHLGVLSRDSFSVGPEGTPPPVEAYMKDRHDQSDSNLRPKVEERVVEGGEVVEESGAGQPGRSARGAGGEAGSEGGKAGKEDALKGALEHDREGGVKEVEVSGGEGVKEV